MTDWQKRAAEIRKAQYELDISKGIELGHFVRVSGYGKSNDGICKVLKIDHNPKYESLNFTVKRVVKYDGVLVKNTKTTFQVAAGNTEKVDPDSLFEEALKTAQTLREHLFSMMR